MSDPETIGCDRCFKTTEDLFCAADYGYAQEWCGTCCDEWEKENEPKEWQASNDHYEQRLAEKR